MLTPSTGSTNSNDGTSISFPPELFRDEDIFGENIDFVFTSYDSPTLFPLPNDESRSSRFSIASSVIGASVAGTLLSDLSTNITIVQRIQTEVLENITRIF